MPVMKLGNIRMKIGLVLGNFWRKNGKIILTMVIGAGLLQGGIFWGLERWAFSAVNVKDHVLNEATTQWRQMDLNVEIKHARQLALAFQGEYLVWNDGNGFTVWDLEQERPLYQEKMPPGQRVALVQWLNDRNRLLLIIEQTTQVVVLPPAARLTDAKGKSATQILLKAMNNIDTRPLPQTAALKQLEITFLNADGSQRISSTRIQGLPPGEQVQAAVVSSQANLLYLTLGNQRWGTNLYRVGIQHDALKVPLRPGTQIEKLCVEPTQGNVYAEFWSSRATEKPLVYGIKGMQVTFLAPKPLNHKLLGVDRRNILYLGEGPGQQVKTVWTWDGRKLNKERELPETSHRDNLVIGIDGQVAVIDEAMSLVKVYAKGMDTPVVFSFEAGARLFSCENRFVSLAKINDTQARIWMLAF
ncbi:MAG: hypothetical protein PHC60_02885 [Heliobacteriaceae bacterium]|nr:hypothetical protein [Heliobacteriaceae bacterium]